MARPRIWTIARGVARLAIFRADGIELFAGDNRSVLASLAPLLAFPAVSALLTLFGGGDPADLAELLALVDALLLQMVATEALARLWGRDAEWGRFAAAMNWCQWVIPPAATVIFMGLQALVALGLPQTGVVALGLLGLGVYALGLQWFVARIGLRVSASRAVLLVVAVNLGSAILLASHAWLRAGDAAFSWRAP